MFTGNNMFQLCTICLTAFIISTVILISSCNPAFLEGQPTQTESGAHTIVLAAVDEPGQPLTITGKVVDRRTNEPIPGAQIYLYHADANGEYLPTDPEDESTARLSGEVVTGDEGQFIVHTIVPREYDQPGNRHIHLHYVRADGHEEMGGVILFEDDVNDEIRQWADETGFGIIIELDERDGMMEGNITLQLAPIGESGS
jgi:protocatechuate 3,4-dioxygenase beta subunit